MKFVHEKKEVWDDFLDTSVYAYNTAPHESSGFTPFELMFGRKALLPVDVVSRQTPPEVLLGRMAEEDDFQVIERITTDRLEKLGKAKEKIKKAQEKQKEQYDRKHAQPDAFLVGQKVLKKDFRRKKRAGGKMDAHFIGPYFITTLLGKGFYSLQGVADPSAIIPRVCGAYLKLYKDVSRYTCTEELCKKEKVTFSFENIR